MSTVRASVLSWDWREQPDFDDLARVLLALSGGAIHLQQVDTGSDQFAVVVSTSALSEETVQETFTRWRREDWPDEIEVQVP